MKERRRRLNIGDEATLLVRVKATVLDRSDAHGLCYEVEIEHDDFHVARTVWIDDTEIVEVLPTVTPPG